jgi:hypothetical protein
MNPTEAQSLIDGLEADLDRMRGLDSALKVSMLARLNRLRAFVPTAVAVRVSIKPSGREFSKEETMAAARRVMEEHKDTLRALADM